MDGLGQVVLKKQTHFQIGDNSNLFDFTYVTNVAHAHLLAADKLTAAKLSRNQVLSKPLAMVHLSTGNKPVPTSKCRPVGPAVQIPDNAKELEAAWEKSITVTPEIPTFLTRFDQFSDGALEVAESDPFCIAGQAFFITNGEPVYFWDFSREVFKQLGAPDRRLTVLPKRVGLLFASALEWWGWVTGHEPVLTRYRVTYSCMSRWHNIDKARRVLGYEPQVGLLEGIKRTVEVSAFSSSSSFPAR